MKLTLIPISLCLALGATTAAKAELFVPNLAGPGALVGGIAGAIIGDHNHNTLAGAAIGAVAGAVIGSTIQPPHPTYSTYSGGYAPQVGYARQVGYAPVAPSSPVYSEVVEQPSPQVVYVERPTYVAAPEAYYYGPEYYGYSYGPSVSLYYGRGYRGGWGYRERGERGRYEGERGYYHRR